MRCLFYLSALLLLTVPGAGAQHAHDLAERRIIEFPDVPGYHTLTCDLHTHTAFSDGSVWPDIRVQEAIRDGLDCLAITDHIEYQPHIEDIPHPDRNRSYDLAAQVAERMVEDAQEQAETEEADGEEAENEPLLVLRGAEITRSMPPGHLNAVLLEDVNPVMVDDATEAIREANRQGAFVFWNHPSWPAQKPDAITELTDMHRQLLDEGLFHGIEVVNEFWYSDNALQIALDHNLAILGTSDIHGLVDWEYDVPGGGHRPVTLVFAADRSLEGIGEALRMRRTAVWYKDILIGRPEHVQPLIEASLSVKTAEYEEGTSLLHVAIKNISDAPFTLRSRSEYTFAAATDLIVVKPHAVTWLHVKTGERGFRYELVFEVLNVVTAPSTHPEWTLTIEVEEMRESEGEEE
ncbi:MAG: PHP domain-containing protein [Bacteroidetes bacterium SB0662_bin_6]|nr:PHP domain-containing protein [Bacteroidetes bacterium SB0668_bin_1]MYE03760.1 PHP domain-containing protein [Bacteroidetes bacterium SB0662_bin_6]